MARYPLDRIVAIKVLSVRTLEPTDVSHRFERARCHSKRLERLEVVREAPSALRAEVSYDNGQAACF